LLALMVNNQQRKISGDTPDTPDNGQWNSVRVCSFATFPGVIGATYLRRRISNPRRPDIDWFNKPWISLITAITGPAFQDGLTSLGHCVIVSCRDVHMRARPREVVNRVVLKPMRTGFGNSFRSVRVGIFPGPLLHIVGVTTIQNDPRDRSLNRGANEWI
jgi:hypothetical protein